MASASANTAIREVEFVGVRDVMKDIPDGALKTNRQRHAAFRLMKYTVRNAHVGKYFPHQRDQF
jgi:hypothetical protein